MKPSKRYKAGWEKLKEIDGEAGEKELSKLDGAQVEKLKDAYNDFSPELVRFVLEFGYGDIFSRDSLDVKYRQIATIAALIALGNAPSQLKFHIKAALNIGLTIDNIREIMLLMTAYASFPAGINGTDILKVVVAEQKKTNSANKAVFMAHLHPGKTSGKYSSA